MMRRNSGAIHERPRPLDDLSGAEPGVRAALRPALLDPLAILEQAELEARLDDVKTGLRCLAPPRPSFEDLAGLNREVVAFATA